MHFFQNSRRIQQQLQLPVLPRHLPLLRDAKQRIIYIVFSVSVLLYDYSTKHYGGRPYAHSKPIVTVRNTNIHVVMREFFLSSSFLLLDKRNSSSCSVYCVNVYQRILQ